MNHVDASLSMQKSPLSEKAFEARVLHLIAQVSTVPEHKLRPEQRLREDLGMDSVSSMELLSMLAEDFDLDISIEEAARTSTVAAAIAMAKNHWLSKGVAR